MKTIIIEGIATAKSSISHGGGETNGVVSQLRRERYVQPNGRAIAVPVISGNSSRGAIRDELSAQALTKQDGEKIRASDNDFDLFFSGGHLESTGKEGIDIKRARELREDAPIVALLGASAGNQMLRGKVDMGKWIPICKETMHLLPESAKAELGDFVPQTIWEYIQVEMYTRTDDKKDELKRVFRVSSQDDLDKIAGEEKKSQMMYFIETLTAGTKFYWKIALRDPTDVEFGAFLSALESWVSSPYAVGGKGSIGMGDVSVNFYNTKVIDSDSVFEGDEFVEYIGKYKEAKKDISARMEQGDLSKTLFK